VRITLSIAFNYLNWSYLLAAPLVGVKHEGTLALNLGERYQYLVHPGAFFALLPPQVVLGAVSKAKK
jgi:hypothetical protein